MKPAKTAMNMQRDWALRKASQMLMDSVPDKSSVTAEWKERVVKVSGAVAFTQEPVSYTHLTLPTICSV
eukprot:13323562-Alexandrium_andersonii.AAC.1